MGQSITRVNDHSGVPSQLGHGMGSPPMVGVGRERGSSTPPDSMHDCVPTGVPHIRRKQTTVDHAPPSPVVSKATQPSTQSLPSNAPGGDIHHGDHDHDEQQKAGFGGRLRNGWQTTVDAFKRKHDTPQANTDKVGTRKVVSGQSAPSSPSPTRHKDDSIGGASPATAAMSSHTTKATRSLATETGSKSTPSRTRSISSPLNTTPTMTPNEAAAARHKLPSQQQQQKMSQKKEEPSWQQTTPLAAGMSMSGMQGQQQQQQQPQQKQEQYSQQQHPTTGGHSWWQSRSGIGQVVPPKFSVMNTQPDELHRERVFYHHTTGDGSSSPTQGKGFDLNKSQEKPVIHHHGRAQASLPPMMGPMTSQPDELHREPAWPSHHARDAPVAGISGTSSGSGGGGVVGKSALSGIGANDRPHSHYWPPGKPHDPTARGTDAGSYPLFPFVPR